MDIICPADQSVALDDPNVCHARVDPGTPIVRAEGCPVTVKALRSGRRTRSLAIAKAYLALALSRDGRTAAVGVDGGIQLVDAATGRTRTANIGLAGSPNWVELAAAIASSSVPTGITAVTGPKISSCEMRIAGVASVNTVGSM